MAIAKSLKTSFAILAVLTSSIAKAQLSGNYSIGSSGDYSSFSSAVSDMESQGLSGSVTFTIAPGDYKEQLFIDGAKIAGNDTYSISFVGSGSTADVLLYYDVNSENSDYTLQVEGVNNILFRRITFQNTSAGNYATVATVGNSEVVNGITFDDCDFLGQERSDFSSFPTLLFFNGNGANDILVQNCIFRNNYFGLTSFGTSEVQVLNNQFFNQTIQSISLSVDHARVEGNYVENDDQRPSYSIGLEVWSSSDFVVNRNTVLLRSGAKGMQVQSSSLEDSTINIVSNNYLKVQNSTNSAVGMTFDLASDVDFVHNTVRISSLLSALSFTGGSNVGIYNNILQNTGNGSVYSAILSAFHSADYNVVYSEGILSTLGATLAEHQSASGLDTNSTNLLLDFRSDNSPEVCHYSVNNTGVALTNSVARDFFGNNRVVTSPDIGAYEFDLPATPIFSQESTEFCLGDTLLLTPESTFETYLWSLDSITDAAVEILTAGNYAVEVTDNTGCTLADTIAVATRSYSVDLGEDRVVCAGDPTMLGAAAGFVSYDWSTGATTDSIEVAEDGTFSLIVTDDLGCTAGDTVVIDYVMEEITPNFLVAGVACTEDTIQFIEVSDVEPVEVFWDFGDGTTSTDFNPTHNYNSVGDYSVIMTASLGQCDQFVEKEVAITSTCMDYLIAYYPLDTGANDISDNLFDGTTYGGLSFENDNNRGSVATFDGTDDFMDLSTTEAFKMVDAGFTVSAWVKLSTTAGIQTILGTDLTTDDQSLTLGFNEGKALMDFSGTSLMGTQTLRIDQWHLITYIYDIESEAMYIYIDGELDGSLSEVTAFAGRELVSVGMSQGSNYLNGSLDDLQVWREPLTSSEIFEAWSGHSTELTGYYPLQADANDLGSSGTVGTLIGDVTFVSDEERGNVAYFDGKDDRISLGAVGEIGVTNGVSYSVSTWAKFESIDGKDAFMGILGSRPLNFLMRFGRIRMSWDGVNTTTSDIEITPNEWHHVRFNYLAESGTKNIFVDGQLVLSATGFDSYEPAAPQTEVFLGASLNSSNDLHGYLSDFKIRRIYDGDSEKQVSDLATASIPEKSLLVFPNPTTEFVNIQLDHEGSYDSQVRVYDMRGKLVQSISLAGEGTIRGQLSMKGLDPGMYLLRLAEGENAYTQRIIFKD